MQLKAEQLAGDLRKRLHPVYLVSGDEPLLVQECVDKIRQQARQQGCTDREVLDAGTTGFDWQALPHSAASMSLFAERRLIELRLADGKPGTEGSRALCEYLEVAGGEDVLLISAGRIDRQSQQSKWYRALERAGATIQVWPVNAGTLPGWLRRRVSAAGMRIDEDALQLLAERVEGNLLAAVQELKKLELLAGDGGITAQTVIEAVSDNARYSLFGMADSALGGDAAASLRMLRGLRGEGTEPPVALWALVRELRTLFEVRQECDRGSSPEQALSARRVWKSRIPLLRGALSRHDGDSLSRLLELAAAADGCIKGYAAGDPWDNLEQLVTGLALRSR